MKTISKDFYNMKEQWYSNAKESCQSDPSNHAVNLAIVEESCEVELARDDLPSTIIENPLIFSKDIEYVDESNFDDTLWDYIDWFIEVVMGLLTFFFQHSLGV